MTQLGKTALSGLVRSGGQFAFDKVMQELGFADQDFGHQIDLLQSGMDTLNGKVSDLTKAIEELQDNVTWQGFLAQHTDAKTATNLIYANFGYVIDWIEQGIVVDQDAWTKARSNIADSLTVLAGAKADAAVEFVGHNGLGTKQLAGSDLRSDFSQMAKDSRPEHHEGKTLQQFLKESGVPSKFVLDHSGGWKSTGWQVKKLSLGMPHLGIPPEYELKPLVGKVKDNNWVEEYSDYCAYGSCLGNNVFTWSESDVTNEVIRRRNDIRAAGGYNSNKSHYSAIDLTDELNHGGRPADLSDDAIEDAAFGT